MAGLTQDRIEIIVRQIEIQFRNENFEAVRTIVDRAIFEAQKIKSSITDEYSKFRDVPVSRLDIPLRTVNALEKSGYRTVGEIASANTRDVLAIRNLGDVAMQELRDAVRAMKWLFDKAAEEKKLEGSR